MIRFRIVKNAPVARTETRKSLANEFARLRMAGKSDADALRILFDMVTEDGPVPEIEREQNGQAI
jgi:hypothetical protein